MLQDGILQWKPHGKLPRKAINVCVFFQAQTMINGVTSIRIRFAMFDNLKIDQQRLIGP